MSVESVREQIKQTLLENPSLIMGAGLSGGVKRRTRKARGMGVVESMYDLVGDGRKRRVGRPRKVGRPKKKRGAGLSGGEGEGGFLPLLGPILGAVAGPLMSKILGRGRSGGSDGEGGFLPLPLLAPILGAVAGPIMSKILGKGMSGGRKRKLLGRPRGSGVAESAFDLLGSGKRRKGNSASKTRGRQIAKIMREHGVSLGEASKMLSRKY